MAVHCLQPLPQMNWVVVAMWTMDAVVVALEAMVSCDSFVDVKDVAYLRVTTAVVVAVDAVGGGNVAPLMVVVVVAAQNDDQSVDGCSLQPLFLAALLFLEPAAVTMISKAASVLILFGCARE